ncbi:MAG TPA: tRNA pseudouridine(38-40) synthase TruA [Candidatus Binataceae bacterium]|nr:tRNA pseudouridine(38-40) synthase TruA [Candidatus Binataceae bacterium]
MRVRLTVEYDGTNYFGWQLQSGQDTIQARLEAAFEKIFRTSIRVHGAGRTDAGVHARGQVAAATLPREFDPAELRRALNALLPADIGVLELSATDDKFDPRRDARSRVYEYRVLTGASRSAFEYRYSWLVRDSPELAALNYAARVFIGEHDFAAFRTLGSQEKTTVRRVLVSEWRHEGAILVYRIEATGFLRHMVRTMVAAMVEVGCGRATNASLSALLEGRDRSLAPAPAPAAGLYLVEVKY